MSTKNVTIKKKLKVQELLFAGYATDKIANKLEMSVRQVYRYVQKIRDESSSWLENLAEKEFVHTYREALEGLKQDTVYLREMLEEPEVQKNPSLRLKIMKAISELRRDYLQNLNGFPIVWSMDFFIKKNTSTPINRPTLKSLGDIDGVKK